MLRAFQARLDELHDLLEEVALEPEDYQAAGEMVLEGRPPNGPSNQQFKDCLFWKQVLRAAEHQEIVFVTNDGGFYDGKSDQLEPGLAAEHAVAQVHNVRLLRTVEALLDEWRPADFGAEFLGELEPELLEVVTDKLKGVFEQQSDLTIGQALVDELEAFAAEAPDRLLLSGTFQADLLNSFIEGADTLGIVSATATATVDGREPGVVGVDLERVEIVLMTPHGDRQIGNIIFGGETQLLGSSSRPFCGEAQN